MFWALEPLVGRVDAVFVLRVYEAAVPEGIREILADRVALDVEAEVCTASLNEQLAITVLKALAIMLKGPDEDFRRLERVPLATYPVVCQLAARIRDALPESAREAAKPPTDW